jgi:hypothetical protein
VNPTVDPTTSRRSRRRLYRRRKPWPAIIILIVLAAAGATVWVRVLDHAGNATAQARCPAVAAPAGHPALTPLPYSALNAVQPIPASQVRVRTLNASSQVGLATRIALELQQHGFTADDPANDPYHPKGSMRCFGQIRFGPNGEGAARTLSLVVPCAQLIRDDRQDTSVDLALGTYFTDLAPSRDALRVLSRLGAWSHDHPASTGGLQAQDAPPPHLPRALLAGAHTFGC